MNRNSRYYSAWKISTRQPVIHSVLLMFLVLSLSEQDYSFHSKNVCNLVQAFHFVPLQLYLVLLLKQLIQYHFVSQWYVISFQIQIITFDSDEAPITCTTGVSPRPLGSSETKEFFKKKIEIILYTIDDIEYLIIKEEDVLGILED